MEILAPTLLAFELFHAISHAVVLSGWKLLPRRVLVKQRVYFAVDLFTVLTSFALVHRRWWGMVLLQNIQHAFYYFTWEDSWAAKRVISWSSLDWDRGRWVQLDLVIGTAFDLSVHIVTSYFLLAHLTTGQIAVATLVATVVSLLFFFNNRLAWAKREDIPDWIRSRMKPLSDDQRQDIRMLDELSERLN